MYFIITVVTGGACGEEGVCGEGGCAWRRGHTWQRGVRHAWPRGDMRGKGEACMVKGGGAALGQKRGKMYTTPKESCHTGSRFQRAV